MSLLAELAMSGPVWIKTADTKAKSNPGIPCILCGKKFPEGHFLVPEQCQKCVAKNNIARQRALQKDRKNASR